MAFTLDNLEEFLTSTEPHLKPVAKNAIPRLFVIRIELKIVTSTITHRPNHVHKRQNALVQKIGLVCVPWNMAVPRTLNLNHFKKNTRLSQEIQDFLTKHKTFSRNTRLSQETQDFHTKHKTFTRITRLSQKTQDFHKKHKTFLTKGFSWRRQ